LNNIARAPFSLRETVILFGTALAIDAVETWTSIRVRKAWRQLTATEKRRFFNAVNGNVLWRPSR